MDLVALRYFYEVSKTGNISIAAYNLNVTQPTITRQLKLMEDDLGVKLYNRVSKGIQLTTAGHVLKEKASEFLYLESSTRIELSSLSENLKGILTIACANDAINSSIANTFISFSNIYPSVKVCLLTGDMDYVDYCFRHGLADMAIGYYDLSDDASIDTKMSKKLGVLMQKTDKLSGQKCVTLEQLYNLPLFAPKKNTIGQILKKRGISYEDLKIFAQFDSPINYLQILMNGGRYALCLEPSGFITNGTNLCFKPLEIDIQANICVKYDTHRNNPFVNAIIDVFKGIPQ